MKLFNTIALFSFVFLLTLFSCEIGLGSSVDTAAPKIEILTPEVNSVHKEVLKITGTATDEISIRSVNVNLVLNGVSKYSYNANVTPNGEWVVEIPTVNNEGNNVVQDAKYEIQAVAKDSDGKTSVATRSLQVDNTPPTILVTSPSLFDDNKSSFFRQLRVSGSAYDASEISNVKVYFYSKDKFTEDSPFSLENLENDGRFVSYNAEGTNTWNLTQDLPEKDEFFENNLEYNFFVIAEDEAGNKNTYFYRMGDFYNKEIIKDTTNDGDDYIPFPSMMQIGKFDQGLTVENPTSGLSAEGLESIKIHSDNSEENNSNFLYRSESAPSVSWGNIEFADGVPRTIPRETDITGQIKTSDTTDILPASVEVWLASGPNAPDEDDWWKLDDEYVTLDPSGTSAGFNIVLKKGWRSIKIRWLFCKNKL